jgi:CubicO group peptidase (beta-lactamase class C family)
MLPLAFLLAAATQPAASVRVTFDKQGVTSVASEGLADASTNRAVRPDDTARIASISKLVTTIAVMRLVERGTLDLDADVSKYLGYRFRNPAFPDTPITLRLLLSHRSSLTDRLDYAVPMDVELRATLADPKAWDSEHPPGAFFRYTNFNFPVVAAVMERATDERFDRLMDRLVLGPLKLHACFQWTTCDDATIARGVLLYRDGKVTRDDNGGKRPACPVIPARDGTCDLSRWRPGVNGSMFAPQSGLHISMPDLAKVGRLLMLGGKVDGVRLLTSQSVKAMITPAWTYDGTNGDVGDGWVCSYGLGVILTATPTRGCRDDAFRDSRPRYGHSGDSYGLKAGLWIDPARGTGVAYFATDVPKEPGTRSAYTLTEENLARP